MSEPPCIYFAKDMCVCVCFHAELSRGLPNYSFLFDVSSCHMLYGHPLIAIWGVAIQHVITCEHEE